MCLLSAVVMGGRRVLVAGNLDPDRKRSGGLRTKQAGRGSCRGTLLVHACYSCSCCSSSCYLLVVEMGQLLREVLRTLCGVNQWCYAVFWKIGCQNPKLLIWEECYYEPRPCSAPPSSSSSSRNENVQLPYGEFWASDIHDSQLGIQASDRLHLLINKMMTNNQVNVVGEGMVGRAAFTGKHEWILTSNYLGGAHPPEVLNEVHHQFSSGMQTVAVIPVPPHGVVQLGSNLAIMENMGFVNNVKSLILQLGCVPGALLPNKHTSRESIERIGMPISAGIPVSMPLSRNFKAPTSTTALASSRNQQSFSSHASVILGQPSCSENRHNQYNLQTTASTSYTSNMTKPLAKSCDHEPKSTPLMKLDDPLRGQLENGVVGAEVIPLNPDSRLLHQVASSNSRQVLGQPGFGQSDATISILKLLEEQMFSGVDADNNVSNTANASITKSCSRTGGNQIASSQADSLAFGKELHPGLSSEISTSISCPPILSPCKFVDVNNHSLDVAKIEVQNVDSSSAEQAALSSLVHQLNSTGILPGYSDHGYNSTAVKDEPTARIGSQSINPAGANYEGQCSQPSFGDDLYDILGVDFKNKLLSGKLNDSFADGSFAKLQDMCKDASALMNMQESTSFYPLSEGIADSSLFSLSGTDNLLEAVVSKACSSANQSSDDTVSCRTTLTKASSSSIPSVSPAYGQATTSSHLRKELYDLSKSLEKPGAVASSSFRSSSSTKDDIGCSSQTTSIYGSQFSSWIEQGQNLRRDSSFSPALSKKNEETSKPNRKRLKPGENPRPRPKDRQMIQDRVKELREIVPNGAKCSIDALLERTIKHMLFLQSVTKHADKLKQTGDSKIMNKEGGLLLKEHFEGGATWAYEVGSRSMVCPIIVEDLNPPRQLLVEILCEERGLFLEIADLIRGLGLTILKGVMEARSDKIWARFAVEANRDVTRMEIFMSLVQLLEQTMKGGVPLENKNMMVQHGFPLATSIPATGRPSSLQ
ncbi:hypothetical protein Tsubulata_047818 [Turnera subulata]|uniref:BHLH domain-containing protein n=1 Tax=Turnera subulata TaxID=218843 RepID=A0A9Q0F2W5_9ROSI|nr:hypothetical protein Tsubulata_047818 [Turnera subulata]